jgi:hypothetical protein
MRLTESSFTRLKACLLIAGAASCVIYAGVQLRCRLQRPGTPPVEPCPFADNTVALLRELHDGPFRFGDPTPVAAAARKEAMRRIRRQQAHRRRLRRKMRLMLFRTQWEAAQQAATSTAAEQQQQARRSTLCPSPIAPTENVDSNLVDVEDAETGDLPLPLVSVTPLKLNGSCCRATEGLDYEGRFVEQHRRLQAKTRQHQWRHPDAVADAAEPAKTFVTHARAMLLSPVDGVLGTTRSLTTSSYTESETCRWRDTEGPRRPRRPHDTSFNSSRSSSCSASSSSSCASSGLYSSQLSSSIGTMDSYTSTSTTTAIATTTTSSTSSLTLASSPASGRDDAGSLATAGSTAVATAATTPQDRTTWNTDDVGEPPEASSLAAASRSTSGALPPQRSLSSLSHPAEAVHLPLNRFSASYLHAPPTAAAAAAGGASSHLLGGGAGNTTTGANRLSGAATSVSSYVHHHQHSHLSSPQQPHTLDSAMMSLHNHHHHYCSSSLPGGGYLRTASCAEGGFASITNATLSNVGGEAEDPYVYPTSTLYGPPLFATEMDVTDALAELRSSTGYSADRPGGSCLGVGSNNSNTGSHSGLNSGGGGGLAGSSGPSTGVANLLGGALTLCTVGQPPPPPPPWTVSTSPQGHGMSSSCYPSFAASYFTGSPTNASAGGTLPSQNGYPLQPLQHHSHPHRHHSRGHRSSGQSGTHHSHFHSYTASSSAALSVPTFHHRHCHQRTSSTGGSASHQLVSSSRASLRHSHNGSPSNSQLLPVYTMLPGVGGSGFSGASPLSPLPVINSSVVVGPPGTPPLSRRSSQAHYPHDNHHQSHPHQSTSSTVDRCPHSAGAAAAAPGMVSSFHSTGDGGHRRSPSVARRWWRRTRRHLRRCLHDWREMQTHRVLGVCRLAGRLCRATQACLARGVQATQHSLRWRCHLLATAASLRLWHRPTPLSSTAAAGAGEASAPLSKRAALDGVLGDPGKFPTATAAEATTPAVVKKPDTKKSQDTLDANNMVEAIDKVVEMLAPLPGRVPTVVAIRAPLGYDVTNDADSLWTALHLDSASFEEGLIDVVILEELKTEPLPPVPAAQAVSYAAAHHSESMPREAGDAVRDSSRDRQSDGGERTQSLPHPLSLDSAPDAAIDAGGGEPQRQSAHRSNLLHIPPPVAPTSLPPAERAAPRSSTPPPPPPLATTTTSETRKPDLRITFELYPAHVFYSSIIRAAILQEKDLALRRAAAELYGGSADLDGSSSNKNGVDTMNYTIGSGGLCGSPASPSVLARAASSSVLGTGQRSSSNSHIGGAGSCSVANSGNTLNSVENFCLTPITPGHFLRAPRSPKVSSGTDHSRGSPVASFSHPIGGGSAATATAGSLNGGSGGGGGAHGSGGGPRQIHSSGPSMLSLPLPPSAGTAANTSGMASGGAIVSPPTSQSPTLTPSLPGCASNVVVRLSASYSFPALPPQVVRSPPQTSQMAVPHTARGLPLPLGSVNSAVLNAHGNNISGGGGTNPAQGYALPALTRDPERYSAARRFVNRSEVLLYIHVLRTTVANAQTATTALPSCAISDFGEEDGLGGGTNGVDCSVSDTSISMRSAMPRSNEQDGAGDTGRGGATSPSASARTTKPPSTRAGSQTRRRYASFSHQGDAGDGDDEVCEADGEIVGGNNNNNDAADVCQDEREEEAQTLLELRQREVEAPVLLRYRLRICHQGSRSLEALKRTERYVQDHVQVWQDEARKMLRAMPPIETAVMVSAVASGQRLSSMSTPSLIMMSSPVLRPADAGAVRLPPPLGSYSNSGVGGGGAGQRPTHGSSSRFSGLPLLSLRPAPLASNNDLDHCDDRDSGPLHLPAWAMEVLIRRESMRETLIRDLKEKAFRICTIPLPDMRVHCLLPPVVPRYAVAHARGFPLSRTFAEEVLSQQRTLQFILLQREQENQRAIAAELRRAMRRQERHERHRRERHAREEKRRIQQAERKKKRSDLRARLTNSMNPATLVSRVASMVKNSTRSRDPRSLNSTERADLEGEGFATTSVSTGTTLETAGSPSTSTHDAYKPEGRSGVCASQQPQQQRRHGQPVTVDVAGGDTTARAPPTAINTCGTDVRGTAASSTAEEAHTVMTTAHTTGATAEGGTEVTEGGVAERHGSSQRRQRPSYPSPSSSLPSSPSPQQPPQQPPSEFQLKRSVSHQTLTSPAEHEIHFFGESSQNSTAFETPQDPALTAVLHAATTTTTGTRTGSNGSGVSSSNNSEAFSGAVSALVGVLSPNSRSGERRMRNTTRWSTPPITSATTTITATTLAASAPPPGSLAMASGFPTSSPAPTLSISSHLCTAGNTHGIGGTVLVSRTSPLSTPSGGGGGRSSFWTAVHTSTNANTSVTPPPPPPSLAGGAAAAANGVDSNSSGCDGAASTHLPDRPTRSGNPSAIEGEPVPVDEGHELPRGTPSFLESVKTSSRSLTTPSRGTRHGHSPGVDSNDGFSCRRSPPTPAPPLQQQQPLPTRTGGFGDGHRNTATEPAVDVRTPASSSSVATTADTSAAVAGTLDLDPCSDAATHGRSTELGVTPPVLYFTRPQSTVAIPTTTSSFNPVHGDVLAGTSSGAHTKLTDTRASLLVPATGYAASAVAGGSDAGVDGSRVLSSQNSLPRSPPPGEVLPSSSVSSIPPAVPNNSMYGTFDAYYGHSTATPQAVLLRQQAQAATVAGLTSGTTNTATTKSLSLPTHLHRTTATSSPVPSAVSAATSARGAAAVVTTVTTATAPTRIESGRLQQSSTPIPKPATTAASGSRKVVGPRSPLSGMQHLQVPRSTGTAGSNTNNTSGGGVARRSASGLLPYTYSADSVSSMYGTAHYPLYQYPDDTAAADAVTGTGTAWTSSHGTAGSNYVSARSSPHMAGGSVSGHHHPYHQNPSTVALSGLANPASVTAIYTSASSAANSVHNGGWEPGDDADSAGLRMMMESPGESAGAMAGTVVPRGVQDTHMNRLKQYNKLLSDLLGVAGGPMRSGISFYYTYGDATALLYNASIQAPSDEDILELLEQQQWAPQPGQEEVTWDGPLGNRSVDASASGLTMPIVTLGGHPTNERGSDSCPQRKGTESATGTTSPTNTASTAAALSVGTSNGVRGSATSPPASSDSVVSTASPSPPAARIPPTLALGGGSATAALSSTASGQSGERKDAGYYSNTISSTHGGGTIDAAHEDEGCSYLDYSDMPYPEDSMDALEAEQIDAQRTRNKNFYSIFEHLHRAYHDAVFEPRDPTNAGSPHSPNITTTTSITIANTASVPSGLAAAATARQSPPPLGGFTATASFAGSPGSPHSATLAHSFHKGVLSVPQRVYCGVCALVRWMGWKAGLAAAPGRSSRSSRSADDTVYGGVDGVFCGVLRSLPSSFCFSGTSSPCPASSAHQKEDGAENLARRFPGERIVTFGREWRVASHMDMQNGHFGLSPLQVWMATRYSRRFAGEVYLMDVVAAGGDPYYPAVRVLDEVVAHAVLYYHNHSLRDFTEDLAAELGLEYVPQTVWGRRALGLPIDEMEVQELDGLLYTVTRRQQDRRRRQQEMKRRQQEEQQQQQRSGQSKGARHHACTTAAATGAKQTVQPSTLPAVTGKSNQCRTVSGVAASSAEAFIAMEYGNDVDRPTSTPKASQARAAPRMMDSTRLSQNAGDVRQGSDDDAPQPSCNSRDGGEDAQHGQQQQRKSLTAVSAETASPCSLHGAAELNLVTPLMPKPTSSPHPLLPRYSPITPEARRRSTSSSSNSGSDDEDSNRRNGGSDGHHCNRPTRQHGCSRDVDPFAGVDENLWIEMQSYDQEEDEEVFYGATAAAVVGIGSGDINMAPHIYDAVMEREVYDERMLLRELDHLKDFLIEHRNVLSSAMLTTAGSNALEAVFGVPATVFPFLLCARESVPLVSSIFESLSYHYGALTYDNFSKMTYDAYHVDRPDVLRHTPRLFRMVNKSRRGCITYEELCGWVARKLSCGNNIQPNAHLLAVIMSLRLPLALVAESRESWDKQRCALKSLSDAEDEEY